ncbi:hypothetical protein L7F22_012181 [Adiantum nelumboides]|nr:hypothetical protein [Adiantum nelumboides]
MLQIKKTDMAKKEIVIALHHEGKETKHVLRFVLLKEGGKFKELREEIDFGGLASEGYRFLGGSWMLRISQKQEEMWIVSSDEVLIEYTSCEETPSKRPRVDSSGASNDIDTISPVSQKESETPNLSTSTDIRRDESGKGSHLKSLFASRSEIRKWQRDIETMKEKLRLKGRKDRFELMAKDKEGKALFQIWCEECETPYGQGGLDTIYNYLNSHMRTIGHMRAMGLHHPLKQPRSSPRVGSTSEEETTTKNKKCINDAMEEFTSNAYSMASGFPYFRRQVLFSKIEHVKSKSHIKATAPNPQEVIKKGGCPNKSTNLDDRQKDLTGSDDKAASAPATGDGEDEEDIADISLGPLGDVEELNTCVDDEVTVAECELRHVMNSVVDDVEDIKCQISPFVEVDGKTICKSTLVSPLNGIPTLSKDRLTRVKGGVYDTFDKKVTYQSRTCLVVGSDCVVLFERLPSKEIRRSKVKGKLGSTNEGMSKGTWTFDMADQEERKIFLTYLRSTLYAMVSGFNNRQMRATVENKALTEEFVEKAFSKAISLVSFLVLREKARQSTYNIIGNMEKCANDLQANLSPDVDLEKLKNWDTNWRVEKIKCKRASEIDTQHVFSKKMRIKLAVDSLNSAGTKEPASLLS